MGGNKVYDDGMNNTNPRSNAMNTTTFDWSTVTYTVNDDGERIITGYKTKTENVLTSQLNVGDVVHAHGMRILLDRTPMEFGTENSPAYSYNGRILNIEDIDDPFIQVHTHVWENGVRTGERRWTVQSNDLVSWAREIA